MQLTVLMAVTSISAISYMTLLILLLLGAPWKSANRLFALYLAASFMWNLGGFMMFVDTPHADMWSRVLVLGLVLTFFSFFHFVLLFLNIKGKQPLIYLGYVLFGILGGLGLAGLVMTDITIAEGRFEYEMGPAIIPTFVAGYTYMSLAMFYLIQRYRATQDEFFRNKLRYPILGLSLIFVGGATNASESLGAYGLDHMGNIVTALLVGYAILRHRLLNLRFVIRRGLVYSSLMIIITAIYLIAVFFLQRAFQERAGYSTLITALVVAVFVAALFLPFRNLMQRLVDRLFSRERQDYQDMLRSAGKAMTGILNLEELTNATMDLVNKTIHVKNMSLFVLEGGDYVCHPQLRKGHSVQDNSELKLKKDNPIITYLATQNRPLVVEEMGTLPQFRSLWKEERRLLDTLSAHVLLPLKARGQLVGYLVLGPKPSEEPYSSDELDLLSMLANQMSVAVDNARLFEEVRRSYEELKNTQDYLVQSERLRALGQMASGVAHDFNNLLAAILGRAQLALELTNDEKTRKNLKIIEEAALGGAATVRRLLTFTKMRTDQSLGPVDLNEVIENTLRMAEAQRVERQEMVGIKINVVTQLGKLDPVLGNAGDLRDALTNLVLNAVDAMPQGGTLTVKTWQDDNLAVVSVSDTGVGIPDEMKDRLFVPFYTTKGARGTGLGLSVVYGIVSRHGGKVAVESEEGKGSTFYIKLPISSQAATSKTPVPPPRPAIEASVLLVDDDREVGEVLRLMLAQEGYKVTLATSGKEAVASFRQHNHDLVVTDLGMPDMSGRDVARKISSIKQKTPIILITGWGMQLNQQEVAEAGIGLIIAKPFSKEEFLSKVAQALNPTG
ncbi:MAG: response regulator [Chloroflexi bacterium]|nr:response regulator [Chloroflexota bacterium]